MANTLQMQSMWAPVCAPAVPSAAAVVAGLPAAYAVTGFAGPAVAPQVRLLGTSAAHEATGTRSARTQKSTRIDDAQGFPPRGPAPA